MAKNTNDTRFRRVDVDEYAEDKYEDDVSQENLEAGPNEQEVQSLLTQGNHTQALGKVLANAPYMSKNQAVKDRALQLVLKVLLAFKASEMEATIKNYDEPTLDTLMKYIFRGFEVPSEGSSDKLLTWYEKVFRVGGHGCIVRVLTDRRRV